jgi:hypothetical protein
MKIAEIGLEPLGGDLFVAVKAVPISVATYIYIESKSMPEDKQSQLSSR